MRIWDIDPGYLARQQLLGEHRELHGLANILIHHKRGYANHPETKRWVGHLPALATRHRQLAAEMKLRGYHDRTPLDTESEAIWPQAWIDPPARQFELLRGKYAGDGRSGRIPLPGNCQELWAQHKYSVMARSPQLYKDIGVKVAKGELRDDIQALSLLLVQQLRIRPDRGRITNALLHMWGYLSGGGEEMADENRALLDQIQRLAVERQQPYLLASTALGELAIWL